MSLSPRKTFRFSIHFIIATGIKPIFFFPAYSSLVPCWCRAGHFGINKSGPFLIPPPLIHFKRCLFQTPCWRSSGHLPVSTAREGLPFWFSRMDLLTILHTAGEHH
jgi:hypothetical protein